MKRRGILIVALTIVCSLVSIAWAEPVQAGTEGLRYEVLNSSRMTAQVTGYSGDDTEVNIPETTVINGQSYTVEAIAPSAFSNNKNITSLTIPSSMVTIHRQAFNGCTNLKEVDFGEGGSDLSIYANAFANTGFESVKFTNRIVLLAQHSFANCENLTNVDLSDARLDSLYEIFGESNNISSITYPREPGSVPEGLVFDGWVDGNGNPVQENVYYPVIQPTWRATDGKAQIIYNSRYYMGDMIECTFGVEEGTFVLPDNVDGLQALIPRLNYYENLNYMRSTFAIRGWRIIEDQRVIEILPGESYPVEAGEKYNFEILWAPELTGYSFTKAYDGQSISVNWNGPDTGFSKWWVKVNDDGSETTLGNSLSGINEVSESGTYYLYSQRTGNGLVAEFIEKSKPVTVDIRPVNITVAAKEQTVGVGEPFSEDSSLIEISGLDSISNSTLKNNIKAAIEENISLSVPDDSSVAGQVFEDGITLTLSNASTNTYLRNCNVTLVAADAVVKSTPVINISLPQDTYKYTGDVINPTVNVESDKDDLTCTLYYNGTTTKPQNVGEYVVTAKSENNPRYNNAVSNEVTLTVEKADVTIGINPRVIANGDLLPAISFEDLTFESDTLNTQSMNRFKSSVSAAIDEGRLTFGFYDGSEEIASSAVSGEYSIVAIIADEDREALSDFANATFETGTLTIKEGANVVFDNVKDEITFTGEEIVDPATASVYGENGKITGADITYKYFIESDGEYYEYGYPLDAGTYYVKAFFAGNNDYAPSSSDYHQLDVVPADITITWVDKGIGRGEDFSELTLTSFDFDLLPGTSLSDDVVDDLKSDIINLIDLNLISGSVIPEGVASAPVEGGTSFIFSLNGGLLTLDQLFELIGGDTLTPEISASIGLMGTPYSNLNISFENGDIYIKEPSVVSFISSEGFVASGTSGSGINNKLVTEFANGYIDVADNIRINGQPFDYEKATLSYGLEPDGDFDEAPIFGSYYVKVEAYEDETYCRTESILQLQINPATVTITANDQRISVGGIVNYADVTVEGRILENDEGIRETLMDAIPSLFGIEALKIELADGVDTAVEKEYKDGIVLSYDHAKIAAVDPSLAEAALFFNIVTVPGDLVVGDPAPESTGRNPSGGRGPGSNKSEQVPEVDTEESGSAVSFTDIHHDDWHYEAIDYVVQKGIMNGMGGSYFVPDGAVTRAQVVTMLYRLEEKPEVASEATFKDIDDGEWYSEAVAWASSIGLVNGFEDGSFFPDRPIIREQMAVIFARYAEYKNLGSVKGSGVDAFSDAGAVSGYALDSMDWAANSGLMNGTYGKILPKEITTRAQAATIIMRYCEEIAK